MRVVDAAEAERLLDYPALIEALAVAFRAHTESPDRTVYPVQGADAEGGILFLMPAWRAGAAIGVKLVTYFPGNARRDLPWIHGQYVLFDGATGVPRLLLDGTVLTRRRTAAMAALAARYLARPDSTTLLMVGTGSLAPHCVRAHAAVLPLRRAMIWGRDPAKARAVVAGLAGEPYAAEAVADLAEAIAEADVIVCATSSRAPLVLGEWLRPGQHVALLGSFQAGMCETDDDALKRGPVFADTREGVLAEAGEIIGAIERSRFAADKLAGDLADLAADRVPGRSGFDQITLFKSVGTAIADLAGAELADRLVRRLT